MKRTTMLTLASLCIACAGFAQQTKAEQAKIDRIKKDPATYQNDGGIIDSDELIIQPEKMEKIVDPNGKFVIYPNGVSKEEESLKLLNLRKEQNTQEYRDMKDTYMHSFPATNEIKEEAVPRSAEERKNSHPKK